MRAKGCKGALYRKARTGEIKNYTGVSSPYEEPENADITLNTSEQSLGECIETLIQYLQSKKILTRFSQ